MVRLQHPAEKALRILLHGGSRDHHSRRQFLRTEQDRHAAARQQTVLRIGKLGPHRYAAGAGVDPVIDRGQHPVAPFTINLNLRQPRLLQSVDIGVLAGFTEKRGFVEGERDPHRIQLHNVHQHAAGRIDQRPDVKGAMAHATGHRRRNPGVAEHNLLGLDAGFGLLYGSGGDVALHPGRIDVVAADGVVVDKPLVASEQLLRLT